MTFFFPESTFGRPLCSSSGDDKRQLCPKYRSCPPRLHHDKLFSFIRHSASTGDNARVNTRRQVLDPMSQHIVCMIGTNNTTVYTQWFTDKECTAFTQRHTARSSHFYFKYIWYTSFEFFPRLRKKNATHYYLGYTKFSFNLLCYFLSVL